MPKNTQWKKVDFAQVTSSYRHAYFDIDSVLFENEIQAPTSTLQRALKTTPSEMVTWALIVVKFNLHMDTMGLLQASCT